MFISRAARPFSTASLTIASIQAKRIRDSRGMPEFVFNPSRGETYPEAFDLKGNPDLGADWWSARFASTRESYRYTVAHWAATEARFRRHFKRINDDDAAPMIPLDDVLVRITQESWARASSWTTLAGL